MLYRLLKFDPKDATGGTSSSSSSSGSGGSGSATTGIAAPARRRKSHESRAAGAGDIVDRLVHRYGSEAEALRVLAGENFDFREREREREQEIEDLKTKQVPDGAVVLTGDDAKAFTAIKATGVALDKVAERVKLAGDLEGKQAATERRTSQDAAAKALKWNPDVLAPLLDTRKLVIELRDVVVKEQGKADRTAKVPYVREDKQGASWERLDELVTRDESLKNFLPALQKVPASGTQGTNGDSAAGSSSSGSAASTTSSSDTIFPFTQTPSQGGGSDSSGDAVDKFVTARNKSAAARTNPLVRSTAGSGSQNGAK
jgi:hypothetical protein